MLNKLTRVFLSLALFISTTGLTIDKHYCGDNVVSYSLFGKARSCTDMDESCCHEQTDTYRLALDCTPPGYILNFDQDYNVVPAQAAVYNSILRDGYSTLDQFGLSPPLIPRRTLSYLQTYRL